MSVDKGLEIISKRIAFVQYRDDTRERLRHAPNRQLVVRLRNLRVQLLNFVRIALHARLRDPTTFPTGSSVFFAHLSDIARIRAEMKRRGMHPTTTFPNYFQ